MSEARIYKVPVLVGQMRLPVTSIVVAPDKEHAVIMALNPQLSMGRIQLDEHTPVEELGTAHASAPRVIF